jgi:hypothetical protein
VTPDPPNPPEAPVSEGPELVVVKLGYANYAIATRSEVEAGEVKKMTPYGPRTSAVHRILEVLPSPYCNRCGEALEPDTSFNAGTGHWERCDCPSWEDRCHALTAALAECEREREQLRVECTNLSDALESEPCTMHEHFDIEDRLTALTQQRDRYAAVVEAAKELMGEYSQQSLHVRRDPKPGASPSVCNWCGFSWPCPTSTLRDALAALEENP